MTVSSNIFNVEKLQARLRSDVKAIYLNIFLGRDSILRELKSHDFYLGNAISVSSFVLQKNLINLPQTASRVFYLNNFLKPLRMLRSLGLLII